MPQVSQSCWRIGRENVAGAGRATRRGSGLKVIVPLAILLIAGVVAWQATQRGGAAGKADPAVLAAMFTSTDLPKAQATAGKATPAGLVVADFTAEWCGPCKMMKAGSWSSANVAEWMKANATGVLVDVDAKPTDAQGAKINAMPTIVVYRGSKEVARNVGYLDAGELLSFLQGAAKK